MKIPRNSQGALAESSNSSQQANNQELLTTRLIFLGRFRLTLPRVFPVINPCDFLNVVTFTFHQVGRAPILVKDLTNVRSNFSLTVPSSWIVTYRYARLRHIELRFSVCGYQSEIINGVIQARLVCRIHGKVRALLSSQLLELTAV